MYFHWSIKVGAYYIVITVHIYVIDIVHKKYRDLCYVFNNFF